MSTTFSQTDPFVPLRFTQLFARALALFLERKDLFLIIAVLWYIPNVFIYSAFPATAFDTAAAASAAAAAADDSSSANDEAAAAGATDEAGPEATNPQVLFANLAMLQLTVFLITMISILAKAAIVVAVAVLYNRGHPELGWCAQQVVRHACGLLCAYLCTIIGGALTMGLVFPILILLWISQNVILQIIAVLIGLVLAGAYLYLILSISMIVPSVMVEHKGPIQSVKRSFQLLAKDFCLVFGTILLLTLAGFGITFAMGRLPLPNGIVGAAVKSLPSLFLMPFDAILTTVVYFNLRITHEGLNRDILAQEVQFGTSPHDPLVDDGDVEANKVDMDGAGTKMV